MTAKKITSMDALGAAPADDDQFVIVDVSDTTEAATGTTKKLAASRVARTGTTNTFTGTQNINAATAAAVALSVGTQATPTQPAQEWKNNGVQRAFLDIGDTVTKLDLRAFDNGSGVGPYLLIRRNNNASTPAAGHLVTENRGGAAYYSWVDNTGVMRLHTSAPTNANDTAGTVIGTQTSWHETKEQIAEWDGAEALDAIRALTLYSYQMIEDGHQTPDGDKPTYYGIVITDEDRAANAWFGLGYAENQIPALNDRNLIGYTLAAIRHGGDIIEALQAQVAALEARVSDLEGA